MHIAAAQLFSRDHFAGRRFHQWRAAQKYRALIFDNDRFITHRGHIGTTGCARSHHAGDLRNPFCGQVGLVIKDATKVFFVWKYLVLQGQKSPA